MALPKRRHSTQRGRKRRSQQRVAMPNLIRCSHCSQLKLAHRVCPLCGYYNNQPVVEIEEKKKKHPKR